MCTFVCWFQTVNTYFDVKKMNHKQCMDSLYNVIPYGTTVSTFNMFTKDGIYNVQHVNKMSKKLVQINACPYKAFD